MTKHETHTDERRGGTGALTKPDTDRIRETWRAYITSKCNLTLELYSLIMQAELLTDESPEIQLSF